MNTIIRVTGAVTRVTCADPHDCVNEVIATLTRMPQESDLIVLPAMALCSPSCGSLFFNTCLTDQCEEALRLLKEFSTGMSACILAGLVVEDCGRPLAVTAVLYHGELLGLIPAEDGPSPGSAGSVSDRLLPADTVFACGGLRFSILSCALPDLTLRAAEAVHSGIDLLVIPAYSPVHAGEIDLIRQGVQAVSQAAGCAVALVNGGVGDTSSPWLYNGFVSIYECGRLMAHQVADRESFSRSVDLDADVIRAAKRYRLPLQPVYTMAPLEEHPGLLRELPVNPWLPEEHGEAYLTELFRMQVQSLATRMENIGVTRLVIGVSGGLDSAAALLVCAGAVDALGLSREHIIAVTLPGFGTSDRTYYNALRLIEILGATGRDISIRQAVQLHLEDIGHASRSDTTYENAQARERTQILLDLANSLSGIVVGTGDLSEEALGFCTFAGDHISSYNVNVCIPKTLLRCLVAHVAEEELVAGVRETLQDVLDTPVSPELLPPSETGDIQQKTEEILGPYELHDFFLYYFLNYRMRPSKIYFYACTAFAGRLEPRFIMDKLRLFFRKFCAAQFKRACAPDCASITEINLCGVNHYIPSDLDPGMLLRDLEQI